MISVITQTKKDKYSSAKNILISNDNFNEIHRSLIKYNFVIVDILDFSQIPEDTIHILLENSKTYFTVESITNLQEHFDLSILSANKLRIVDGEYSHPDFIVEKFKFDEIKNLKLSKEGLYTQVAYGLKEIFERRKMIFKIAKSNFQLETKNTTLGGYWHIVRDIIFFFTYITFMLFLRGGGEIDGLPFIMFLMTGLLPWYYVSDIYNSEVFCIKRSKGMISKIGFPVTIIPIYSCLSAFYKRSMTYLILLLVVMIYYFTGDLTDISVISFLYYNFALISLMMAFVMLMSPLVALSKDLAELYKSIMRVQMYFLPIFWDFGMISSKLESSNMLSDYSDILLGILMINPVSYILNGFRESFGGVSYITPLYTIIFWVMVIGLAVAGLSMQYKLKRFYADVL